MKTFTAYLTDPAPNVVLFKFKATPDSEEQSLDLSIDQVRVMLRDLAAINLRFEKRASE